MTTSERIRVAIADDSGLIYSDNYREGWVRGFRGVECDTQVFDIAKMRQATRGSSSHYRTGIAGGWGRQLASHIIAWKPHFVWCHHGRAASEATFLQMLQKANIPTAVYLCDEPYETGETAAYSPKFDYVFSMDYCTLDVHREARDGRRGVFYLPPCAEVDKFRPFMYFNDKTDQQIRDQKALFVGNADLIPRREWMEPIERLVPGTDIRYFPHRQHRGRPVAKGHQNWIPINDHPALYRGCVVGLNVHRSPSITNECFRTRVQGRDHRRLPVPKGIRLASEMPAQEGTGFWNDANLPASHVNPRFFEMAACGTLVVSDAHRPELARMFPMAPRAENPAHFLELVSHYMQKLEEAEEIGKACSSLILRRHSYQHRACEVLIRLGFREARVGGVPSYLGLLQDWLTPQDLNVLAAKSSLEPIGHSGRWSPRYGMSLTSTSGDPREATSINAPPAW